MEKVHFGVGCFALVPSESVNTPEVIADWRQIESGIGLLPSATQLVVDIRGLTKSDLPKHDVLRTFARQPILDAIGHPGPGSVIRFDLTIPQRKHTELLPWLPAPFPCERFQYLTVYTVDGPTTFIRPLEDMREHKAPALMVALVREFLTEQLEAAKSSVSLITTGPSPYPAEFSLCPRDTDDANKEFNWEQQSLSYDHIRFYYDPKEPAENAYVRLAVKLYGPFSNYYKLVRMRDRRRARSEVISTLAEILIEKHSGLGIRGWFVRTFRSARLARSLMLDVIRAKQLEIEESRAAADSLNEADSAAQLPFIEKACQEEIGDGYLDILDASQEIARTLEGTRLKSYEVFILAASTLLGGAAGAIAALLAG